MLGAQRVENIVKTPWKVVIGNHTINYDEDGNIHPEYFRSFTKYHLRMKPINLSFRQRIDSRRKNIKVRGDYEEGRTPYINWLMTGVLY